LPTDFLCEEGQLNQAYKAMASWQEIKPVVVPHA